MTNPTFAHTAEDPQAQIAEMAVSRASRPSRQEIIRFALILEDLIREELSWNDELILETNYEPIGLLGEAIRKSGRTPNVHHLSWFKRMKINSEGSIYESMDKQSWKTLVHEDDLR